MAAVEINNLDDWPRQVRKAKVTTDLYFGGTDQSL